MSNNTIPTPSGDISPAAILLAGQQFTPPEGVGENKKLRQLLGYIKQGELFVLHSTLVVAKEDVDLYHAQDILRGRSQGELALEYLREADVIQYGSTDLDTSFDWVEFFIDHQSPSRDNINRLYKALPEFFDLLLDFEKLSPATDEHEPLRPSVILEHTARCYSLPPLELSGGNTIDCFQYVGACLELNRQKLHPTPRVVEEIALTLAGWNLKQRVKNTIAEQGYVSHAAVDHRDQVYLYTAGLEQFHGENLILIAPLGNSTLGHMTSLFAKMAKEGPLDTTVSHYFPEDFVLGENNPLRFKLIAHEDDAVKALIFARYAKRGAPETKRWIQIQLGDNNNLLPDEEGYNQKFQQSLDLVQESNPA